MTEVSAVSKNARRKQELKRAGVCIELLQQKDRKEKAVADEDYTLAEVFEPTLPLCPRFFPNNGT